MWYNLTLIIGIVLLLIGLFILKQRVAFLRSNAVSKAKVIEIIETRDSDGDRTYKPLFQFKTNKGQQLTFQPNFSSNPSNWYVGDEARIVYEDGYPGNARLLTYFGAFDVVIILIALALPLLTIGVGYHISQAFFRSIK